MRRGSQRTYKLVPFLGHSLAGLSLHAFTNAKELVVKVLDRSLWLDRISMWSVQCSVAARGPEYSRATTEITQWRRTDSRQRYTQIHALFLKVVIYTSTRKKSRASSYRKPRSHPTYPHLERNATLRTRRASFPSFPRSLAFSLWSS